jgi:hypothetical protein
MSKNTAVKTKIFGDFTSTNNDKISIQSDSDNKTALISGITAITPISPTDAKEMIDALNLFISHSEQDDIKKKIKELETNIRLCWQNVAFFDGKGSYIDAEETRDSIRKQNQRLESLKARLIED